ncbi:MAG: hypothetical protein R3242_01390 [Akkermansiaceae bacterium]|nr:hypothetical protein [Akkermansiaceae bacterium]
MNPLATWKIAALFCALMAGTLLAAPDAGFDDVDGPNVRIIRHADGSRTRFTRTPDNTTLTKMKYGPNGVVEMVSVYRMDEYGNPLNCKIYDGNETLLFKVRYGYRKQDGQLVEEQMFDARVKRIDPMTGEEVPIQRTCYLIDGNGNRSAPIVINLKWSEEEDIETFEKRFGIKSSMYEENPFEEGTTNPNARPLNR